MPPLTRIGTAVPQEPPITSVVKGTNSDLIQKACKLWLRPNDKILDTTWGEGGWWKWWSDVLANPNFAAHDLYTLDEVDFRALPEANDSIDAIFFDPPYSPPGGAATKESVARMREKYGQNVLKGVAGTFELIEGGLRECARVLAPKGGHLFVKVMDFITSGKFVTGHAFVFNTCRDLGLEQVDEFIHFSGTGPQPKTNLDGSPRRQIHSRRAHTFLMVFEKS